MGKTTPSKGKRRWGNGCFDTHLLSLNVWQLLSVDSMSTRTAVFEQALR